MSEEKKEMIMYVVSQNAGHPEMALLPFMHAVAALAMEIRAVVFLMSDGVWLAKKGYAEQVMHPGKPTLDELLKNFFELGGELYFCTPCAKGRGIEGENLIEGAVPSAAARYNSMALEADAVISY